MASSGDLYQPAFQVTPRIGIVHNRLLHNSNDYYDYMKLPTGNRASMFDICHLSCHALAHCRQSLCASISFLAYGHSHSALTGSAAITKTAFTCLICIRDQPIACATTAIGIAKVPAGRSVRGVLVLYNFIRLLRGRSSTSAAGLTGMRLRDGLLERLC